MPLLSLQNVSFTYGGEPLLDEIDLEVEKGERVGLLGRNGAGKSTLMKIVSGELAPDDGEIRLAGGSHMARLVQEVPEGTAGAVAELVEQSLVDSEADIDEWKRGSAVDKVLSRMKLDGTSEFATLSSGMKRRVLLARALVSEPDLLLLDEPTNHLDIDSIAWLERFLNGYAGTLLFVTHDRVFLRALATRIIEIDRGQLFDWTCDYQTFLKRKQQALDAEEKQNAEFDRKLAEEERWIRQGIKARRTRNEGRVRALKAMREERRQRRDRVGNVKMESAEAEKSGRMVIEAKGLQFAYDDTPIVNGFTTTVMRGDRVGLIGPNGVGKSTLLKLLLGNLEPQSGSVRHGTKLEIIYFDQLREQLDEEKTVVENVGEGQDQLVINGRKKHIYGYLQDFLFTPERARRPARFLSGGERNRMLLARLFKKPSNVMVLDEPTNDLDSETLELLEELVADYSGTVLVVSHDRAFLNNVVTSTFAFEGNGAIHEYDGGYDDYVRQRPDSPADESTASTDKERGRKPKAAKASKPAKLSYREREELDGLPDRIEQLETRQTELHVSMADPEFFKQPGDAVAKAAAEIESISTELEQLVERWEELAARE